jgi:hypothetical protein
MTQAANLVTSYKFYASEATLTVKCKLQCAVPGSRSRQPSRCISSAEDTTAAQQQQQQNSWQNNDVTL